MSGFKTLICSFFLFTSLMLHAQEVKQLDSKVVSATVFTNQAIVTREAKVNLNSEGNYILVFPNLTTDFSSETVKISGKGTAKVKIVDVKTEEKHTAEISNELLKKEQGKIDSLKSLDRIADDKIAVLQSQKSFIESLKAESAKQVNQKPETAKPSIQDWQNMVQFFSKNLSDIYSELRSENLKKKNIADQIKTIEDNIRNLRTGHDRSYKEIYVTVQTEQPGSLTLQASYLVYNASWSPVYDARVFTENKTLELSYFGMIRQKTGEDWKNISLTLSTANPGFNFAFPILNPQYLSIRNDYDSYQSGSLKKISGFVSSERIQSAPTLDVITQKSGVSGPINKESPAPEYNVQYERSQVKDKDVFTKFSIPAKANIPSDNTPHKVHIGTEPMAIVLQYKAVPKLVAGTFLSCKAANKTDLSLAAGQMSVYLGDDFVNKYDITSISPGDTLNLSLGMDDGIKTERKRINRFIESKGLFGGKKSVTYEFEISVTNNKSKEQDIIVNDQLPISQNENIEVKLLYPKENELNIDKQKIITWKLKLQPGEKKVLPLKYSIVFPDNINLNLD